MTRYLLQTIIVLIFFLPSSSFADIVSMRIVNSRDDAEEEVTGANVGNVFRSSSDLEIGNQNGIEQWVGLRYRNLAIPRGSKIKSATIRFTATALDVGSLVIPIQGQLSPDTLEFSDLNKLTTRPRTIGQIQWTIPVWDVGDSGPNTTTPNLAPIVQEIVNQGGWSEGNSMVFLFKNQPLETSERIAMSFDQDPSQSALLTINFLPGKSSRPTRTTSVPEPSGISAIALLLGFGLVRRRNSQEKP